MKYTDDQVQEYIKSGLKAYKELVKCYYRNTPSLWKKLTLKRQVKAARDLVYMGEVAKNPKQFLAPEYTLHAWMERINKFMNEREGCSYHMACFIVPGPKEIVYTKSQHALNIPFAGDFYHKYHNFLKMIQDYEYARDWEKEHIAELIVPESKRVCDLVEIRKANCFERPLKKIQIAFRNMQKTK